MLVDEQIRNIAHQHDEAERSRTQIPAFTQALYPDISLADAYRVQKAWVDLKQVRGRLITGYKVGLTSRAMQQAMQIDEPDFGTLLDEMHIGDGARIDAARYTDPCLEVELAFVLKKPLEGDKLDIQQVLEATDHLVPAMELIAARTWRTDPESGYVRTVRDTIADNAANAGYVLGSTRIPPDADLPWIGGILSRNGVVEETGLAAGILGHPAEGLCWLARRLAHHGERLEAGQVCLAGSFTRPVRVRAGDRFVADYGRFGQVSVAFV